MSFATPPKILIVDDEPNIAIAIDFLMQQQGFLTQVVHDGEAALQAVATFQPNLIILDVMMPEKDGFEVAMALRRNATKLAPKLVFLTAKGTTGDKMEGYRSGGDAYLTKPFDNQQLIDTVTEMLEFEHF